MIQKRYQYYSRDSIQWTPWFNYCDDDSQLDELLKKESKQLGKLKNEFRIV